MGYWENTVYINTSEVEDVASELTALIEAEGMDCIPRPKERKRKLFEAMQYDSALQNNLWGIAVFPGNVGWVVIKTAPLELLGERALRNNRMRFIALCERLRASGFLYCVYDSGPEILVEVNDLGDYAISGFTDGTHGNPLEFYGEKLHESRIQIRFELLPYQDIISNPNLGITMHRQCADELANAFSLRFGGENHKYCDNLTSVDTLISHKPMQAKGGIDLYFQWPKKSRPQRKSCDSWAELKEIG